MARAIGINHVALEVGDLDQALEWYGRFLEFQLRARHPTMAWIDLGDQFIALSKGRYQAPDERRHFRLAVDDKEALRAALRDGGVKVHDQRIAAL
jgi:lactoylglutathione lyase